MFCQSVVGTLSDLKDNDISDPKRLAAACMHAAAAADSAGASVASRTCRLYTHTHTHKYRERERERERERWYPGREHGFVISRTEDKVSFLEMTLDDVMQYNLITDR